jgi:hypothetical protein
LIVEDIHFTNIGSVGAVLSDGAAHAWNDGLRIVDTAVLCSPRPRPMFQIPEEDFLRILALMRTNELLGPAAADALEVAAGVKERNGTQSRQAKLLRQSVAGMRCAADGEVQLDACGVPFYPQDTVDELVASDAVAFTNRGWLTQLHRAGCAVRRRQELPEEALVRRKKVLDALASRFGDSSDRDVEELSRENFGIISCPWLSKDHPDPAGVHLRSVAEGMFESTKAIFWDYLSLHQAPRDEQDAALFGRAIESMHLIFSLETADVYRIVDVPDTSENATSYADRGWTTFETVVACSGKLAVFTIRSREVRAEQTTPVPLLPAEFNLAIQSKLFSEQTTDLPLVISLYRKIWPEIRSRLDLDAYGWSDEEAKQFLAILGHLTELKELSLSKRRTTRAMDERLRAAMRARGGVYHAYG